MNTTEGKNQLRGSNVHATKGNSGWISKIFVKLSLERFGQKKERQMQT